MPIKHAFTSTKTQSSDPSVVSKNEWNADHTGSAEWDTILVRSGDQSVTNSAVLVNDDTLTFSVLSGEVWRVELSILFSSDGTGDYKCDIAAPISLGWHRYVGTDTTGNAIYVSTGVRTASAANITALALGGGTTTVKRHVLIEGVFEMSGNGTFYFRFAQNTQTSGQSAVTRAGSILKAKKLA